MSDLFLDPGVVWTAAVALGYPVLALMLVEVHRHLRASHPETARLIQQIQVTVLPLIALHLLLSRVAGLSPDGAAAKLVLTAVSISAINAVLLALNLVVREGPLASEAMARTPGLMLDLARLILVLVASAFVASEIWAVDLGSLLAALGVGSVVIGLALQDTLSGLFSGVSLMSGRHFREGDWIEFGEASGQIVKMDWRSVTIQTLDDERLMVIPNSELAQGVFTVLSSSTRVFGQNLYVKFNYGVPPARAMEALDATVRTVPLILADPAHDIDLMDMGDDGIAYEITIHTATREDGEAATTDFLRRLWYRCQREGLVLAGAVNRRYLNAGPPSLAPAEIAQILARTEIFLPDSPGFAELQSAAKIGLFDAGERLLDAGLPARRLFLVVSGEMTVTLPGATGARILQRFGPGEFFISRALLTGAASTVDLVAEVETMTLSLEAIHVIDFLNQNPPMARRLEQAIDAIEGGLKAARTEPVRA